MLSGCNLFRPLRGNPNSFTELFDSSVEVIKDLSTTQLLALLRTPMSFGDSCNESNSTRFGITLLLLCSKGGGFTWFWMKYMMSLYKLFMWLSSDKSMKFFLLSLWLSSESAVRISVFGFGDGRGVSSQQRFSSC